MNTSYKISSEPSYIPTEEDIQGAEQMDAYLSDFDERHTDDAALRTRISARARFDQWEAEKAEMREQGREDAARRLANTTPLKRAYLRYLDDGLADTDGHFAPLNFEEWKRANTTELPATPAYDTMPSMLGRHKAWNRDQYRGAGRH